MKQPANMAREFVSAVHGAMGASPPARKPKRKAPAGRAGTPQPRARGAFMDMGRTPAPTYGARGRKG